MKKHISFPSIEKFSNIVANINRQHNFVGLDDNGDAIYDLSKPKPILTFTGTVKLHGCFEKDTLITLANGETIAISEIKIGDYVLSYDILTNTFIEKEVYHVENGISDKKWVKLYFDNNSYIECTESHNFYTKNRGWVEAKDLTENDIFLENNNI